MFRLQHASCAILNISSVDVYECIYYKITGQQDYDLQENSKQQNYHTQWHACVTRF
jgi:hypothetical protein